MLVVFGHLAMAVIDRNGDGSLRGSNIIELYPQWEWLTMLAPMPLFFAASGWANTSATWSSALPRVRALIGLAAVVAASWSVAAIVESLVTGDYGIIRDGARLATQPLWFLTAWVPFTIVAPLLTRIARRPALSVALAFAILGATDLTRFVGDAPRWFGFPGFFAAWGVPWVLGAAWRHRFEQTNTTNNKRRFNERLVGVVIVVFFGCVAASLAHWCGYRAALIDAIPNKRSNTTPPTLFTAVAACVQVGLLMVCARSFDRVATRFQSTVARLSTLSAGVYAWHLTALSLCGALLALGVWTPDRLTSAWWWSRPLWFAAILALTFGLIVVTRIGGSALKARSRKKSHSVTTLRVTLGTSGTTVGAGLIGLYGPRNTALVLIAPLLLAAGWYLLRD